MSSVVTVTDLFCGAGGSSLGAAQSGAEIRMALNHWELAVQTHNSNFPNTDHHCCDASQADPRYYPRTTVLIASPECTNHSLAKGKGRARYQADLWGTPLIDPAEERSRATMWDVPRFAEVHRYELIIVENVIDARAWVLWDAWLHAMQALGYDCWERYRVNAVGMETWRAPVRPLTTQQHERVVRASLASERGRRYRAQQAQVGTQLPLIGVPA